MRTTGRSKISVVVLAAAALSACASQPKPSPAPSAPPRAPYVPPPPASPYAAPAPGRVQTGPLPGSARDFIVNVGDRIYFDFEQYQIRDDARPILAAQAAWLTRYRDVRVRIEGNCDERGTREYNFALGARRANAVREFLVEHGVGDTRISTISYGKEHPIDLGQGDAAWAHNRNAHTALLNAP